MKASSYSTLVLIATLLLSYAGFAQNTLDIAMSGGISKQLADDSTPFGRIANGESLGFAYRIGASYSAKIARQTHICVGGNYTSLATKRTFDPSAARWGSQWNGTAYDPTLSTGEDFSTTVNVSRVSDFEAPVTIRYYFGSSERIYALAGLVPALHIRYVNVIKPDDGDRVTFENTRTDFESFQLATRIGVGTDWPITEKAKLFSQIQGQVHLLEEIQNSSLRWWDVSLKVGIRLGI